MTQRPRIGLHCERADLYRFERDSRLPIGYFDQRIKPRTALLWSLILATLAGLIISIL